MFNLTCPNVKHNDIHLINSDCFDVFDQIENESIDCILADLPYGTTACKWDSVLDLESLWKEYLRIIKVNGAIILTSSQPFTSILINSCIKYFRYEWIWVKSQGTNPLQAKIQPLKRHENVLIFYKKLPTYNPQMTEGSPYKGFSSTDKKIGEVFGSINSIHKENLGTRYPTTILKYKREYGYHPTQKPVGLMKYFILTYTNKNDIILDNTMGSGTTGIACLETQRQFIGIEKEKKYYDIAKKRVLNNVLIF